MSLGVVAPKPEWKTANQTSGRSGSRESGISKSGLRRYFPWAASGLSGLLLVACFPKIHLPGLVWIACLPVLLVLSLEKRLKQGFFLGYICGAVFFAGSCYWFVIVMESYGHLAPALSLLVLFLFVVIDSIFFGAFGLAMALTARRSSEYALALSPFLWMAMELARTYLITGFPWNLLGYALQAPGLRQIAAVTGVYGLSFLAVATSALLAGVLRSPRRIGAGLVFAGWLAVLLLAQRKLSPPPAAVGKELAILIQPNVPLDDAALESWIPWRDPTQLRQLVEFSLSQAGQFMAQAGTSFVPKSGASKVTKASGNPPLLVWAENPAPFFFSRDPVFRNAMQNMARQAHAYVITNTVIPLDTADETISNSAITLDPEGREISRYDKIHLVPFGEYVPWWALPGLVHKITSEVGNFVSGSSYAVANSPGGGIGVFICYEAIVPQLARKIVANGAGVLVNISNDAWYGESAAAYQHLEMARFRAIENHRYLLRATNNGLTTLIDPWGRVVEEAPRYRRLAMPARFDFETRQSFYSVYGDIFAWFCTLIAGVGVGYSLRRMNG
jgi:apolipoprotein N-acyltransferase